MHVAEKKVADAVATCREDKRLRSEANAVAILQERRATNEGPQAEIEVMEKKSPVTGDLKPKYRREFPEPFHWPAVLQRPDKIRQRDNNKIVSQQSPQAA